MNFKRTTNSTANLEEFIDGADTQREQKKEKKDIYINVKLARELADRIKLKYPVLSLTQFIEQALMEEIPYIKEEILSDIYQQSKWHNMEMEDFVKYKMGLVETPEPSHEEENVRRIGLKTNKENRKIIKEKASSLHLSVLMYSEIKIKATYQLKDIFTFDELMQFKAEAMNYDLELDEYIAMRIKG
ncbi:hypothetical protein JJB27_03575 [Campylobacter fetus subsp. venerealis]|uniref:hypothetical protein n=1 Tax=Campylobacter fetus TaxID=196 RepID=UPI0008188641|nr:hypothetical protein [Campylobacter fetus]MBK3498156.1 hypothetical protein [Campylobacter fetus subsp. venerealis]MBK3502212.1 hypothetical protein [Campylobacter fetus subsp. venerealis]OCS16793.1 hypothetical protein CfvWBT01109_01790 [Campylobacter fetus subsp. venerealis]